MGTPRTLASELCARPTEGTVLLAPARQDYLYLNTFFTTYNSCAGCQSGSRTGRNQGLSSQGAPQARACRALHQVDTFSLSLYSGVSNPAAL